MPTELPGFVDAHTHLEWAAEDFWTVRWHDVPDRTAALTAVSTVIERMTPGHWVLGGDWLPEQLPELPTLAELDQVTGDRPLLLRSRCTSMAVLNSAALRLCGIDRDTRHPEHDWIDRNDHGAPTGLLRGPAVWSRLASGVVPPRNTHRALAELRALLADMVSRGVTEVHDIATYPVQDAMLPANIERSHTDMTLIDKLHQAGELPLRVGYRLPLSRVDAHAELVATHDDQVFPAGYKLFLDDGWFSGGPRINEFRYPGFGEALRLMRLADRHGAPVSIHAIGDLGVTEALDLIAELPNRRGTGLPPHRVIHARCVRPEDIVRCADLGVVVETQPWEITRDFPGPLANPYATLLAAGVRVVFGSDRRLGMRLDLRDADPLAGIQMAVTHGPQRISVAEALRCASAGAEVARPGRVSQDRVVLDANPGTVPEDELANIRVLATIVGGRVVYDREGIFS